MLDLYLGLVIMSVLMGGMFALALLLTRKAPKWTVDGLAGAVVILIAVYARFIWDDTFVAQLLPFSNLIILSNWFPLAAGFLSGLVWRRIGNQPAKFLGLGKGEFSSRPRKVVATSVLCLAGIGSAAWPLFGRPPDCGNVWEGNICLQTTTATCSAAAAATLLQEHGVYATEQEMAELCLTRRGTSWKGLFRGLSLKANAIGYRVEVRESTVADLLEDFDGPCILQCELPLESDGADFRYDMEGWVRGQPHSVVLFHIHRLPEEEAWLIADPTQIYEVWSRADVETLWQGQMLRLVPIDFPALIGQK